MENKKILILGASGFLGRHLVTELNRLGWTKGKDLFYPSSSLEANLLYLNEMKYGIFDNKYDYIFLCTNWFRPGNFNVSADEFINNNVINNNVMYYWKNYQQKATLVTFGSDASYDERNPHSEFYYLAGEPNPDYYSYGLTKRYLYQGLEEIRKQTDGEYYHFVLLSIFGEDFNLDDEHLIHALTKKVVRAKHFGETASLWGTGEQIREITYVKDVVKNVLQLLFYPTHFSVEAPRIWNLGSENKKQSIKEYMKIICEFVGYDFDKVLFDTSKTRGVQEKHLNNDKAYKFLNGWSSKTLSVYDWMPNYGDANYRYYDTDAKTSIKNTIDYYKKAIGV